MDWFAFLAFKNCFFDLPDGANRILHGHATVKRVLCFPCHQAELQLAFCFPASWRRQLSKADLQHTCNGPHFIFFFNYMMMGVTQIIGCLIGQYTHARAEGQDTCS